MDQIYMANKISNDKDDKLLIKNVFDEIKVFKTRHSVKIFWKTPDKLLIINLKTVKETAKQNDLEKITVKMRLLSNISQFDSPNRFDALLMVTKDNYKESDK